LLGKKSDGLLENLRIFETYFFVKFHEAPHTVAQLYVLPHRILHVFNTILVMSWLIWKFDMYVVCISIGISVKLRSKTSIFPDQIFFPTYQTLIKFFFYISPYFDTKIRNFLKSIWYEIFEVNLISVSPIKNKKMHCFSKKTFFIIFLKIRGWCGRLYGLPQ
jgi:hypothetical protein